MIPLFRCNRKYRYKVSVSSFNPSLRQRTRMSSSYISWYSPANVSQVISTLLSDWGSTPPGMDSSFNDQHKAHLQIIFQFWIPVLDFIRISLSFSGCESLNCLQIIISTSKIPRLYSTAFFGVIINKGICLVDICFYIIQIFSVNLFVCRENNYL